MWDKNDDHDAQDTGPLNYAKAELRAADSALENMRFAKSFARYREEWTTLLYCLEKVWVKAERECKHFQNFQPWQVQYARLRKHDELILYLKQARHADSHGIEELIERKPASKTISIGLRPGASFGVINHLKIEAGGVVHSDVSSGISVVESNIPARVEAVAFVNRGTSYPPPTTHLDEPLRSLHPTYLAEQGIRFYRRFLNEAEERFFKK